MYYSFHTPTTASFVPLFLEPSILIDLFSVSTKFSNQWFTPLSLLCHGDGPKGERWLQMINQKKRNSGCVLKNAICLVLMKPTLYLFHLAVWCLSFFFCIQCKAYRSLSTYVDYPVGCYVYSSLTVQSLPKSTILILVFMGPCIPGGRACW